MTMTQAAPEVLLAPVEEVPPMLSRTQKARLALGCAIALAITWWTARLLRVPAYPSFSGSLLGQPSPLIALVAALLAVVIGVVVGTAICGSVRHDAGLFC